MLLPAQTAKVRQVSDLHGGRGVVTGKIFLADYQRAVGGFKFIHDNTLAPGVCIGTHTHVHDEEIYMILEGHGEMQIDGVTCPVNPGDICLTRAGHSHGLTNTGKIPMRLLVVGVNTGPVPAE